MVSQSSGLLKSLAPPPQDRNLPKLLSALRPLLQPFHHVQRHMEAKMEMIKLEGTLQMAAEDGGVPIQARDSCSSDTSTLDALTAYI